MNKGKETVPIHEVALQYPNYIIGLIAIGVSLLAIWSTWVFIKIARK